MQPYFIWKGVDSRMMGLWIQQYPPIVRPPQRHQEITIPGRAGTLTLIEGEDVYDAYVRDTKIMPKPGADVYEIMRWLTGSGEVVFGHEPNRKQRARIYDEASFQREFASQRSAVIHFLCDPFKTNIDNPEYIDVDVSQTSYTLTGRGDVQAYPKFEVTATGSCSIYVGTDEIALKQLDNETAIVDCESRTAYKTVVEDMVEHIEPVYSSGNFFSVPNTGESLVRWSEAVTALRIYPRWRWF